MRLLFIVLFAGLLYGIASVQSLPLSLARLYVPFISAPAPSKTQLINITPEHDQTLFVEGEWQAGVKTAGIIPESGFIRIFKAERTYEDFELIKTKKEDYYSVTLPAAGKNLEYKIFLGDAESSKRKVTFNRRPAAKSFGIRAVYPEYLNNADKFIKQKNFNVIEGSHINFNIVFDQRIKQAEIVWNGQPVPLYTNFDRVKNLNLLKVERDTTYSLRVKGVDHEIFSETPEYKITATKDKPPIARLTAADNREYKITQTVPVT
jgi:hypothetical protein